MTGPRYAVHAYAWTTSWSNDHLDLINHVASLGLDLIEIPLMEPAKVDPTAIRARLDVCGIGVVTSVALAEDADPSSDDERIRGNARDFLHRCVDLSAEMGASVLTGVVYSAIGRRLARRPDLSDMRRSAEVLKDVAKYAAERGLTLGIEPINRYETFLVNTAAQALTIVDMIDEPNVGVHLDAYHMNIEEEDFYEATRAVAGRLVHFHLSESHRGVPGRGTVDWEGIYRALGEAGYAGVVGLESFESMSEAMRAATCIWRQLAPSSDVLVTEGLAFLKELERRHYGAARTTTS
ncbi:MAG TPA: sugar phosphate isomerase/epimerase family protein [Candidatus Baltobacterales bacterium]|nr:sugar phosphate isomerase/epimerase family protein [Candidatus Baltobacterales bacterium]